MELVQAGGLTYAAIGERFGMSKNAVSGVVFRDAQAIYDRRLLGEKLCSVVAEFCQDDRAGDCADAVVETLIELSVIP